MATMMNDTMKAKNGAGSAKDHAEHAIGAQGGTAETKQRTEITFLGAVSMIAKIAKGAGAVISVVSVLRSLEGGNKLGWLGLSRRRSPLLSLSLIGAGLAVGAGVGMLFAPMSGADLRRTLLGREKDRKGDAKRAGERTAGTGTAHPSN